LSLCSTSADRADGQCPGNWQIFNFFGTNSPKPPAYGQSLRLLDLHRDLPLPHWNAQRLRLGLGAHLSVQTDPPTNSRKTLEEWHRHLRQAWEKDTRSAPRARMEVDRSCRTREVKQDTRERSGTRSARGRINHLLVAGYYIRCQDFGANEIHGGLKGSMQRWHGIY